MTINEEIENFSEEEIVNKISEFSSEKLADIIIMHQYLKLYPIVSVSAMNELVARREKGAEFNYEDYISSNLEKLPKVTFAISNISDLVQKIIKVI